MRKSAIGTRQWNDKIKPRILRRDNYCCFYCGQDADTVDHVIPRRLNGGDDEDNLVAACRKCNYSKGGRFFGAGRQPPTPLSFSNPQNTSIAHDQAGSI
jgi:5-methylcytosine-specific restriction endonuclease McrA